MTMTRADHYREAERILGEVITVVAQIQKADEDDPQQYIASFAAVNILVASAQVHAILSTAERAVSVGIEQGQ